MKKEKTVEESFDDENFKQHTKEVRGEELYFDEKEVIETDDPFSFVSSKVNEIDSGEEDNEEEIYDEEEIDEEEELQKKIEKGYKELRFMLKQREETMKQNEKTITSVDNILSKTYFSPDENQDAFAREMKVAHYLGYKRIFNVYIEMLKARQSVDSRGLTAIVDMNREDAKSIYEKSAREDDKEMFNPQNGGGY